MNRTCRYCGENKPLKQFCIAARKNGKEYRRHKCKKCKYATQNKRSLLIQNWLIDLKKKLSCSVCGEKDWRALDFHHQDGNLKDFNLGEAISRGFSKRKIEEEMKKCIVLCSNHHRILHCEMNGIWLDGRVA